MATKSKFAFGSKDNIPTAIENGTIDSYDILFLSNGEVAWLDSDNNTIIETPRLQEDIVVDEEVAVEASTSLEDAIKILFQSLCTCSEEGGVVEFDTIADGVVVIDDETTVVEF